MTITAESLKQTQEVLQLPTIDLWWRYFALGGNATPLEVEAIMHGALIGTSADRDLLATALHERERHEASGHAVPVTPDLRGHDDLEHLGDLRPSPPGAAPSDPATNLEMLLERSVDSPAIARTGARGWLGRSGLQPAFVADVVLIVSELVANAVEHAASTAGVRAELRTGRLRLEVHDTSAAAPVLRDHRTRSDEPRARGGFGLQIVSTLAADWGWTSTSTGKIVWLELVRPDSDGDVDALDTAVGASPATAVVPPGAHRSPGTRFVERRPRPVSGGMSPVPACARGLVRPPTRFRVAG